MARVAIVVISLLVLSGCFVGNAREEKLDSVAYNVCDDELVIWLKRDCQNTDLGMARVPRKEVEIVFRSDGKNYTSVRLIGCRNAIRRQYEHAVIFVPK